MDILSREYMFASELMTSVMELYYIIWKPDQTSFQENQSPFTAIIKKAVEYVWREKKEFIDDLFNTVLKMGTVNLRNYEDPIKFAEHLVTEAEYDEIELLRYCVTVSSYSSLFYHNGLTDVPNRGIQFMYDAIMSFKSRNEFTDESWSDIEILGEAYSAEGFCKDFSNGTSTCVSEVSENDAANNSLQVRRLNANIYPFNILQHKIESSSTHKDIMRNVDSDSFNEYLTKYESKNNSIISKKTKTPILKITDSEDVKKIVPKKLGVKRKFEGTKSHIKAKKAKGKIEDDKDIDEKTSDSQYEFVECKYAKSRNKVIIKSKAKSSAETIHVSPNLETSLDYVKGFDNDVEKKVANISELLKNASESKYKNDIYKAKIFKGTKQEHPALKLFNIDSVMKDSTNKDTRIKTKSANRNKYKYCKIKERKSKVKNIKQAEDSYKEKSGIKYTTEEFIENSESSHEDVEAGGLSSKTANDSLQLPDFTKKVKEIKLKRKRSKRTQHKTKDDTYETQYVVPAIHQVSNIVAKTNNKNFKCSRNNDIKKELKSSKCKVKAAKSKWGNEEINIFKYMDPVTKCKVTTDEVKETKYNYFAMPNDVIETFSEIKGESRPISAKNKPVNNNETTRKYTALSKYKIKKLKREKFKNEKSKATKHTIKKVERDADFEHMSINPAFKLHGYASTAVENITKDQVDFKKMMAVKNTTKIVEDKKSAKYRETRQKLLLIKGRRTIDAETIDAETKASTKSALRKKQYITTKIFKEQKGDRRKKKLANVQDAGINKQQKFPIL